MCIDPGSGACYDAQTLTNQILVWNSLPKLPESFFHTVLRPNNIVNAFPSYFVFVWVSGTVPSVIIDEALGKSKIKINP